jgi:uncharacterized lipoprotein YajG
MKTIRILCILTAFFLLAGCETLTINIGSNNQLFNTRSQATGQGQQEALVEGGGSPTISPTIDVAP